MSAPSTSKLAVLKVFALLFSSKWIKDWQKQWSAGEAQQVKKDSKEKPPQVEFRQRIYTLSLTLWYLIFQRLNADHSLDAVVTNLRHGGADSLIKRGHKAKYRKASSNTSAYDQARQRLPLELLQAALKHLSTTLIRWVYPTGKGKPEPRKRVRQIVDGSTLAMLATPALRKDYSSASNKCGPTDWCIMRIVVGFCALSGAVLNTMDGAVTLSEQALFWRMLVEGAQWTIWVGDRNFGIWSVVAQARRYDQDVVVRLTKARAQRLKRNHPWRSGDDIPVEWSPSKHDQSPPGTQRSTVSGRLIYVRINRQGKFIDLWLFTTLDATDYPVALLVEWYGERWQAELNFRSLKTQMQLAELNVRSPEMARKEFYAGLLAYNLVRAVMWQAGEKLAGGIGVLSYTQARRVLVEYLRDWGRGLVAQDRNLDSWSRRLVEEITQQTLPKRKRKRPSEMRRVRCRSQKFPKFRGDRAIARARYMKTQSL